MIQLLILLNNQYNALAFIYFIVGAISCLLALFNLLIIKYSVAKGFAIPCLIAGISTILLGFNNYNSQPEYLYSIFYASIASSLIGGIIFLFSNNYKNPYWKGFGLGLIIQSIMMMLLISIS